MSQGAGGGRRLLVWGGGGHGKVVADAARAAGWRVAGFVDRDPALVGRVVEPGGARVVLDEAALRALLAAGRLCEQAEAVAVAVGDNRTRLSLLAEVGDAAAPAIVHPAAILSPHVSLGAGSVVFARVAVNPDARAGAGVILNTGCVVEHDCELGDGVHVSPGAVLAGAVRVDARAWVGAGATVIQEIHIGADAIVGAGAVVVRDVPAGAVVVGNPARPLQRSGR